MDFAQVMDAERGEPLELALKGLPDDFLAAMIEGLEAADDISPGRLFVGERGGCVVGVTLRVIDPDFRGRGRYRIWSRRRSIKGAYQELHSLFPRLSLLEQVFDKSVLTARSRFPDIDADRAGVLTAHWVARVARTELIIREMKTDHLDELVHERAASNFACLQ